ncbi:putative efflux transporter [Paenibacillus mucilaginosus 3016]|uniref:Multidrug transporter n=2 Tax=Paenibacillus mucilaginosus TaxID=61624 RepID=I0BMD2_9BACL|nr:DMT family transporter [Paenibacillus mucilaginosus]AFC31210.1 putative efflux transporter [Paenibacillus mucilaginosus 3016]AFH63529.1 multidrug transporter [Paenibacillus mucilaginosus K02]WFA19777.1 DMT family transporter [Paenibacillus mucilaginosus]
MKKNQITAGLELSGAAVLIGSSVVAGKITAMHIPVFFSQTVSLAIALLVLLPLSWRKREELKVLGRKDLLLLLLQAFLGMFLFRVLMLYGLKTASAAEAGILTSFTPAAVALLSIVFLKERMTPRLASGVLFAAAGVACLGAPGWFGSAPSSAAPSSSVGLLLILGAVGGEAALTVIRKLTASSVSPLTGTTCVTFFSFLMFLPFSLAEAARTDLSVLGPQDAALLLYYGVFVTAVAYLLWFSGVSKVSAGTAAVYTGCIPVSTVLLSYALLHEPFSWAHAAGAAFVFLGIRQVSAPSEKRILPASRGRKGRTAAEPAPGK